jgi:pyruvate dehydrogenase E1 component
VDQLLAAVPADPDARELRRRRAVAGGYPIRLHAGPQLTIAAMGAVLPEALAAADRLDAAGVGCDVICVTSADLLFRATAARQGQQDEPDWILEQLFPASRARPLLTVLDGHPHTLAFLAGVRNVTSVHLGVHKFGQSGDPSEVYRYHGIDTGSIVRAGLDLAGREPRRGGP